MNHIESGYRLGVPDFSNLSVFGILFGMMMKWRSYIGLPGNSF